MNDEERALSEIRSIRHQMALSTQFRGYGPASIALSGCLAFGVAALQASSLWSYNTFSATFSVWIATAAISLLLSSIETAIRAHRVHSGLAQEMLISAIEKFLPSLVAGLLLTVVLMRVMPDARWMLPGLWEVIFSLGVFSSCQFLPKSMFVVGVWYLAAGLASLMMCGASKAFSPWAMGVPFGMGQFLVALVLYIGFRNDGEVE